MVAPIVVGAVALARYAGTRVVASVGKKALGRGLSRIGKQSLGKKQARGLGLKKPSKKIRRRLGESLDKASTAGDVGFIANELHASRRRKHKRKVKNQNQTGRVRRERQQII